MYAISDPDVKSAVLRLARHLHLHPRASDTVPGIWRWWLGAGAEVREVTLLQALAWLQARGLVASRVGADGRVRYRRASLDDALLPQVEALLQEG